MAHFYLSPQREPQFLMPVSMRDWLEGGHLAWFVIDVVGELDTAALHAPHPNDGAPLPPARFRSREHDGRQRDGGAGGAVRPLVNKGREHDAVESAVPGASGSGDWFTAAVTAGTLRAAGSARSDARRGPSGAQGAEKETRADGSEVRSDDGPRDRSAA